jgi:hypothetical protein
MPDDLKNCEFFLLRYVPDAVKDEFVNVGVVLLSNDGSVADVRFTRDYRRVRCLDPQADVEMLESLEADLRGKLQDADSRDQILHRLRDSFSGSLQLSPSKAVLTLSPEKEIADLAQMYLESARIERTREAAGRVAIYQSMRAAFERAGVWEAPQMRRRIAASQYVKGDPLRIDCGYRPNGVVKLFHAVSLAADVDSAKVLAFTYPQIAAGIREQEQAETTLTAIIEDDLRQDDEATAFAIATLAKASITIAPVSDMPRIADAARVELKL